MAARKSRELVTVASGSAAVNPNEASVDVMAALPGADTLLARSIVEEREQRLFSGQADLLERVPELFENAMLDYVTFDGGGPLMIVSRARVIPSGVMRTVRLVLKREERLEVLSFSPVLYRRVQEIKLDRWQYE